MLTAILMASGHSKRMNTNKLLLPFQGKPMIEHTLQAIKSCSFDRVIVVAKDKAVLQLALQYGFQSIYNEQSQLGQSISIRLGVSHSDKQSAFMFLVGDQPCLTSNTIEELILLHKDSPHQIILPTSMGNNKNPVIFPPQVRNELLSLEGDMGGRTVIKNHPELVLKFEFGNQPDFFDIDTVEDLEKLKKRNT